MLERRRARLPPGAVDRRSTRSRGSRRWPGTCAATWPTRSTARWRDRHTPAEVAELWPSYPYAAHAPIVAQGAVVDGVFEQDATGPGTRNPQRPAYTADRGRALSRLRAGIEAMPALLGRGDGIGSNTWVVDGEHTTTGEPILANDPHLGVGLPGVWMQVGLHCRTVSRRLPATTSRASPSPACPA